MRSVCLLLAAATIAQAQSPRDSVKVDTVRLSPTVVTVLRTSMELARAPFAVGLATRDEIQRGKPGFALDEALLGIPGVQVDNRFNYALGERISVRGFGARAQFGVRGVRVLLDGIPMTIADGQTSLNNVDVATLSRAEVVRGPASSVHGNASGGVIQLESDRGDDFVGKRAGGELRYGVGEDGLQRYQVTTRSAFERTFAAVSVSQLSYDGYRDWNDAKNDHVNFHVGRYVSSGLLTLVGNYAKYDAHNPGGLVKDSARLKPFMAWPANKTRFLTGEDGEQKQLGATWTQRVGGADLELAGHILDRAIDNPIPNTIVAIDRGAGGGRAVLGFTPMIFEYPLRLSFGSELQLQHDDRRNFVNTPNTGARGAVTLDQRENVSNRAFFAQASNEVMTGLTLMLGVRHDNVRFEAKDRLVTPTNPDDSGERTMSALSPSVGATYALRPSLSIYANYSTSFETPTTSELANQQSGAGGFNPALEPQRTRSGEVGLNGRATAGRVAGSFQLAAYLARVEDALIPFEVASAPGRQYFRNAGSTKHRGVEVGTSLAFPASLHLRGSFTHTEALFDRYAVTVGTTTSVYDGNHVPGIAPNRGDATLSWQPRGGRFFADAETRFVSSMAVNDANTDTLRTAPYELLGVRVGVRDVKVGPLALAPHVGVMNVFDRRYMTSVVVNAFGGRYYEPGPPRSVYGGLSAKF